MNQNPIVKEVFEQLNFDVKIISDNYEFALQVIFDSCVQFRIAFPEIFLCLKKVKRRFLAYYPNPNIIEYACQYIDQSIFNLILEDIKLKKQIDFSFPEIVQCQAQLVTLQFPQIRKRMEFILNTTEFKSLSKGINPEVKQEYELFFKNLPKWSNMLLSNIEILDLQSQDEIMALQRNENIEKIPLLDRLVIQLTMLNIPIPEVINCINPIFRTKKIYCYIQPDQSFLKFCSENNQIIDLIQQLRSQTYQQYDQFKYSVANTHICIINHLHICHKFKREILTRLKNIFREQKQQLKLQNFIMYINKSELDQAKTPIIIYDLMKQLYNYAKYTKKELKNSKISNKDIVIELKEDQ